MPRSRLSQLGIAILATSMSAHAVHASKAPSPGRLLNPLFFSAPDCAGRPDFAVDPRTELRGGLKALPSAVLVARDAEMWIEGRVDRHDKPVQVHSYQSFVQEKSRTLGRIVCGSKPENYADRFSIEAPTLIDASKEHKVGNSMWQFQVIAADNGYSVWNKKSPSLSRPMSFENLLNDVQARYRVFQVNAGEYQLLVEKDVDGVSQSLLIRYEVAR